MNGDDEDVRAVLPRGSGGSFGLAGGGPSGRGVPVLSRLALMAVTVLAVGAFWVLQAKARAHRQRPASGRRRGRRPADWRTLPRPYWPEGRDGEAPLGNEERNRP